MYLLSYQAVEDQGVGRDPRAQARYHPLQRTFRVQGFILFHFSFEKILILFFDLYLISSVS
jgi:hypothetical protein